jgi:hypothetical protein
MVLLIIINYLVSIYFLAKLNKIFIYNVFVFFWFFGFFRLEYFEFGRVEDLDIEYLKSIVGVISFKGFNYFKLVYQIFFANLIIVLFIKKMSFTSDSVNCSNKPRADFGVVLSLVVFIFSTLIIKDELIAIILYGVSGYDIINNFGNDGGNYYLHVFLNRLSLILLFSSIVGGGRIKHYHALILIVFLVFYAITGQRNELFRFIIAIVFWLLSIKLVTFKLRYVIYVLIAVLPLRLIELYRGGMNDISELLITSVSTFWGPLFGGETVVPFYSWPAVLFYEINYEISNLIYWFLDSIKFTTNNSLTSYSIYKANRFPMEARGLAINIFASLNIYFNWALVVPIFALIFRILHGFLKFYTNKSIDRYISRKYRTVVYFWSFASIVLLARNGIEGLRPLLLHDFIIYPFIFILLSQIEKVRLFYKY